MQAEKSAWILIVPWERLCYSLEMGQIIGAIMELQYRRSAFS
jgi:hypothetical protein